MRQEAQAFCRAAALQVVTKDRCAATVWCSLTCYSVRCGLEDQACMTCRQSTALVLYTSKPAAPFLSIAHCALLPPHSGAGGPCCRSISSKTPSKCKAACHSACYPDGCTSGKTDSSSVYSFSRIKGCYLQIQVQRVAMLLVLGNAATCILLSHPSCCSS